MKILVTGGAGFIGSHLTDTLVKKGHQVSVFDNLKPPTHKTGKLPSYFNKEAKFIKGDIRDLKSFSKAIKSAEIVYHLAAQVSIGQSMYQIKDYTDSNVGGVANLLETLTTTRHKVKKVIFSSSATVYGEGSYRCKKCGPVFPEIRTEKQIKQGQWEPLCPRCGHKLLPIPTKETKPLKSQFLYALSKEAGEKMLLVISQTYQIPCVILRYFNVFGPRQSLHNPHTAVFAVFLSRIKAGKPPIVIEDGLQTRDFIYIDDVVRASIQAMNKKAAEYQIINVGTGKPTTIMTVAKELIKQSRKPLKPKVNFVFRKGDIRHCYADITYAKKLLNWQPKVSFATGVKKMYQWAKNQKSHDKFHRAFAKMVKKGLVIGNTNRI